MACEQQGTSYNETITAWNGLKLHAMTQKHTAKNYGHLRWNKNSCNEIAFFSAQNSQSCHSHLPLMWRDTMAAPRHLEKAWFLDALCNKAYSVCFCLIVCSFISYHMLFRLHYASSLLLTGWYHRLFLDFITCVAGLFCSDLKSLLHWNSTARV